MNGFRYTWLLSLMVMVLAGFIALYWFKARELPSEVASVADSDGRNERSTPPTFILPATPAVVREQELRLREHSDKKVAAILNKCSAELISRGYDVGDEMVTFNAKLVEAIWLFQQRSALRADGRFTEQTRKALGC